MTQDMSADEIIHTLGLDRHPEGGWYRQTWIEDTREETRRPCGTCIYFLLGAGERSHWHRVDATEIWLYHAGAPLILSLSARDQGLSHRPHPDPGSAYRPSAADRAQGPLAGRAQHRRLDAGQLHRVAGVRLCSASPSPRKTLIFRDNLLDAVREVSLRAMPEATRAAQPFRLRGAWPNGSGGILHASRDGRERSLPSGYASQSARILQPSGTVRIPPPTQARTPVVRGAEVARPRATRTAR